MKKFFIILPLLFVALFSMAQSESKQKKESKLTWADIEICEKKIDNLNDTIAGLQGMLNELKVFVKNKELFDNKDYLNVPYSKMVSKELDSIRSQLIPYQKDWEVASFLVKVERTIAYKKVLDRADSILVRSLDIDTLLSSMNEIYELDTLILKEQYEDFAVRDTSLSRYPGGVLCFNDIITQIKEDEKLKLYREDNDCQSAVQFMKGIFEGEECTNYYNRYFSRIPFLKNLFDQYKEALYRDPFVLEENSPIIRIEKILFDLRKEADKY